MTVCHGVPRRKGKTMTVEGGEGKRQLGNGDPVEIWVRKTVQGVSDHRAAGSQTSFHCCCTGLVPRPGKPRPDLNPNPAQASPALDSLALLCNVMPKRPM